MTYAIGTVFESDEKGKRGEKEDYIIACFENNESNNVIAIHIGKKSRAMFCWRGELGDDKEAWREYFRNSSIRNRSDEVKRFVCHGYNKEGFVALDRQWGRIWAYLNGANRGEPVADLATNEDKFHRNKDGGIGKIIEAIK